MKKILSLILVVAMIAAMGIVTASADGATVHTSYDVVQTLSGIPFIFANGTGNDNIGDVTSSVAPGDALYVAGWHASTAEIESFGYSINGTDVVWNAAWMLEPAQPVIDAAALMGASDVNNFAIAIPFASGEVTVELYAKAGGSEYVMWTIKYTCNKDFSIIKEINFDDQSDMADFTDATAGVFDDSNFAPFISAYYKTVDGKLVIKDYANIRWWGLSLVPTAEYAAVEFDFNAETLASNVYFCVDNGEAATNCQGDGGKVIVVAPSATDGKLDILDASFNYLTSIDVGVDYTLSAIFEVGTNNYYVAINGERMETASTYAGTFNNIVALRLDVLSGAGTLATFDNIIVKNADLADYSIYVEPSVPGGELDEYEISDVLLQLGDNQLTLIDTAVTTIYEFCPDEAGLYKFTANDESALVGYWGAGSWYVFDQTENKTNVLESNIANVGPSVMVGISGVSEVTLTVERIGDAVLPPEVDEIIYENQAELEEFAGVDGELTYVDVVEEEHTAVLGEDGFYHLDTEDGPILYANIAGGSQYGCSLIEAMSYGQVSYYADETTKIDFIEAVAEYAAVADEDGFYPLTVDLVEMFRELGNAKGWYDKDISGEFIFGDVEIDPETYWLFSCAYVAEEEAPSTEAPETEAPSTEAPETEAPETDVPATEAPETEVPETGDNGVMMFAVIAMMAAAAFVATVVLKKRAR
ncbi:MAG: hypothetical protein J6A50_01645 [Clostridia bacterium]|nr:hypothetical protein [Clostridia bacterium]